MKCSYCKKPINSKKDLVISYFWSIRIPMLDTYHKKCFEDFKSRVPALITPASVDTNRLRSFSIISYGIILFLLVSPLIGLYLNRSKINWTSFFIVSGARDYILLIFFSIALIALFFIPIWNLVIINRIKKLQ